MASMTAAMRKTGWNSRRSYASTVCCRQKGICNALLEYAQQKDSRLREAGEPNLVDDKTVFIVKRS
jgi:hypothetical protein